MLLTRFPHSLDNSTNCHTADDEADEAEMKMMMTIVVFLMVKRAMLLSLSRGNPKTATQTATKKKFP